LGAALEEGLGLASGDADGEELGDGEGEAPAATVKVIILSFVWPLAVLARSFKVC
jgi:hypothetical protein